MVSRGHERQEIPGFPFNCDLKRTHRFSLRVRVDKLVGHVVIQKVIMISQK